MKEQFTYFFCSPRSLWLILLVIIVQKPSRANDIYALENYELVLPFLWATDVNDAAEYNNIIKGRLEHPFTIGRAAFTYLYTGVETKNNRLIAKGMAILDKLDNYPYQQKSDNSIVYIYPNDYQDFKGGEWWSGTGNSSIAIAYLLAYEIYGDSKLKEKALLAINGVINPIDEGGCSMNIGEDALWYLEYVDITRNDSTAYFAHNGFLYSLAAIKYFEKVLDDKKFTEAFEFGMNALEQKESEFYYPDFKWTYYGLNPRTVESLHYSIFELILIESLLSENESSLLKTSLKVRRRIVQREYGLYRDEDDLLVFKLISGPHLYWPDLYPTRIVAHTRDGREEEFYFVPRDFDTQLRRRLFLDLSSECDNLDSVEIFQEYGNRSFKLFSLKEKKTRSWVQGFINCKVDVGYQSTLVNDHEIKISSEKELNFAMVRFIFPYTVDLYNASFFGWTFTSDVRVENLRIDLINSHLESCGRYYVPQPKDTLNLILLKGFSMVNYADLSSKRIKEIRINYYYKPFDGEEKTIRFSNIFASDNPALLYYIMSKRFGDFNFEEKKSPDNFY